MGTMQFITGYAGRNQSIIELFSVVFGATEGIAAGRQIAELVRNLMDTTGREDLLVWSAVEDGALCGCIMLSRLTYPEDGRTVFLLSPVAVRTDQQKMGIGQKLITHAINDLRGKNVDFVLTYGDPNYYCKTGFHPISEDFARAPLTLQFPDGWLAQSLMGENAGPLLGRSRCVPAFNVPDLW